jgi:hypothetical protein
MAAAIQLRWRRSGNPAPAPPQDSEGRRIRPGRPATSASQCLTSIRLRPFDAGKRLSGPPRLQKFDQILASTAKCRGFAQVFCGPGVDCAASIWPLIPSCSVSGQDDLKSAPRLREDGRFETNPPLPAGEPPRRREGGGGEEPGRLVAARRLPAAPLPELLRDSGEKGRATFERSRVEGRSAVSSGGDSPARRPPDDKAVG